MTALPPLAPPKIAMLSVHTSPVARLGGSKTGGMNVYVREVTREIARRGILVDVFTRAQSPEEVGNIFELDSHSRLICLLAGKPEALPPDRIFVHLNEFRDRIVDFAQVNQLTYDAIYSHYWLSGWVAIQLRHRWSVPVAQMFHTLGRMKNRITLQPNLNDQDDMRVRGETEVMAHVDRIIAATPAERSQLLLLYRADRRKIEIVPPGVDLKRFYPVDRDKARQNLGWSAECKHLLFVGRIEPLKGVDIIFEALAHLRDQMPELGQQICLHIIGGDPSSEDDEMQRLHALHEALHLDGMAEFTGAQDQEILPDFYRAAECLIMPSDYESFGMVALEALACGTPVIASEVGGLAFLVQDGKTGYLVPTREPAALAESIAALLTDPQLRITMGEAAVKTAQNYSWGKIVDHLLEVLTMLGTRPRIMRLP